MTSSIHTFYQNTVNDINYLTSSKKKDESSSIKRAAACAIKVFGALSIFEAASSAVSAGAALSFSAFLFATSSAVVGHDLLVIGANISQGENQIQKKIKLVAKETLNPGSGYESYLEGTLLLKSVYNLFKQHLA